MITAEEALKRLQEGNRRYVSGKQSRDNGFSHFERTVLAKAQEPFAILFGCSDSRVPAEIIFDQGLGDLFVIRVAGNIVAPSLVGSVEFAATQFGTPLVVVLGHSQCGAIKAALEDLKLPKENQSRNIRSIVDRIQPSIEALLNAAPDDNFNSLMEKAVRANIKTSVNHLRNDSEILKNYIQNKNLLIVGAEYSLETGEVEFFDLAEAG